MAVSEGITIVFIGFTVIFASLALAIQVAIILWRKFHPRSFETVTFCALCWIPPIVAFMTSSWWFIIFLSIFFSISMLALFKAHQRPLLSSTPGVIFNWFYLVHNCSFLLWMIGSVTFVIGFFIGVSWLMNSGTLCTLNGVYFGLVGDDIAMHITDNLFLKSSVYHQDNVLPKYFDDPFRCSLCGYFVSNETRCSITVAVIIYTMNIVFAAGIWLAKNLVVQYVERKLIIDLIAIYWKRQMQSYKLTTSLSAGL